MYSAKQKQSIYDRLYNQIAELLVMSPTIEAQMATINAIIYHKLTYVFWSGFYLAGKKQLIVGPYQGPLACQILEYPHGVCWQSVIQKKTILVPDIRKFPDHIACDSRSKSEIAIPLIKDKNTIIGVFDIDSDELNAFDTIDQEGIERIIGLLKY